MKASVSSEALATFLVAAHRNTYADKGAAKAPSTRLRSLDYHFERDDLLYHDTYFGMRDYIGEEIIYQREAPIWGMNYFGIILATDTSESEVYNFLRDALMQDCIGIEPARGPRLYRCDRWTYGNSVEGTLNEFNGAELIHRDGELVYRCRYHGGWIS
jgi:Domain of unknown function (DUF5680)